MGSEDPVKSKFVRVRSFGGEGRGPCRWEVSSDSVGCLPKINCWLNKGQID